MGATAPDATLADVEHAKTIGDPDGVHVQPGDVEMDEKPKPTGSSIDTDMPAVAGYGPKLAGRMTNVIAEPPALAAEGEGTSWVTRRSKPGFTDTFAVAALLVPTGSPIDDWEMFAPTVTVPLAMMLVTRVTMLRVGNADPDAREDRVHVSVDEPEQDQPPPEKL